MRWLLMAGVLAASGCDAVFQLQAPPVDAGNAPGFAFRKQISLIAPTSSDLVDYPAAIIVPADPDLAAHVVDGEIWFSAADGETALPYEIERFDAATGSLYAWVLIPQLAGEATTEIFLHYGPIVGEPPPANNPFAVWPDSYAAIWHLSGDVRMVEDSTGNGHALLQADPALQPKVGTGLVGENRAFDGVADLAQADRLRANHAAELDVRLLQSFTYACWVKVTTPADIYDMPLHKGGASATLPGYELELGQNEWISQISDGTGTNVNRVILSSTDAMALRGTWAHLVTVLDRQGPEMVLYVNGSRAGSTPMTETDLSNTRGVSLSLPDDDLRNRFAGEIDEVRLAHRAFDADWIRTEYRNIAMPDTFLEIGSEQALR